MMNTTEKQTILFMLFGIIGAVQDGSRILIFLGVGIIVGIIRVTTHNLWGAIGFHLAFQTMQQLFWNRGDMKSLQPSYVSLQRRNQRCYSKSRKVQPENDKVATSGR